MVMRRYVIVLTVVLAAVAALVGVERLWPGEGLPSPQALGDGSVLKVEAISFGTNHYYHEAGPRDWQLAIGKRLPYALAASLGWHFDTKNGWMGITNSRGPSTMAIFTAREGPGRAASDRIRVVVLDENGNSRYGDPAGSSAGTDHLTPAHYHQMQSWFFPAFPRHGKTLVVRFLREEGKGKAYVPLMQFQIANPQPGPYPTWAAEPWPATKNVGDLAVTLTDLTTGLSESQPTRAALENEPVVTRLALDLEAKGRTNCPWQVKGVEVSDATGNRWLSYLRDMKTKVHEQGVTRTMTLPGNLWPGESAWKMRVELSPTPDVPPDELTTLSGIALPGEGSSLPLSQATNLGGFCVRLQKIEREKPRAKAKRPGTLPVTIYFIAEGMPEDCRLSLVKVSDEQGRKVGIKSGGELQRWQNSFELAVAPDAVRVDCTFGVRKSRFVEFMAKPKTP